MEQKMHAQPIRLVLIPMEVTDVKMLKIATKDREPRTSSSKLVQDFHSLDSFSRVHILDVKMGSFWFVKP